MTTDMVEGGSFPDFQLPDHNKKIRKLSEIQNADALIVIVARGYHYRGDRLQHRLLVPFYPELAEGHSKLVTLINGNGKAAMGFRSRVGAYWPFLYDSKNVIINALDVADKSEEGGIISHTFVLKPGLVIYKVYNGYWYWERPSVEDLRKDLRMLHREMRSEWGSFQPDRPSGILV